MTETVHTYPSELLEALTSKGQWSFRLGRYEQSYYLDLPKEWEQDLKALCNEIKFAKAAYAIVVIDGNALLRVNSRDIDEFQERVREIRARSAAHDHGERREIATLPVATRWLDAAGAQAIRGIKWERQGYSYVGFLPVKGAVEKSKELVETWLRKLSGDTSATAMCEEKNGIKYMRLEVSESGFNAITSLMQRRR